MVEVDSNTAKICRGDQPDGEPILVALERLRPCPKEVGDECWPPAKTTGRRRTRPAVSNATEALRAATEPASQSTELAPRSMDLPAQLLAGTHQEFDVGSSGVQRDSDLAEEVPGNQGSETPAGGDGTSDISQSRETGMQHEESS